MSCDHAVVILTEQKSKSVQGRQKETMCDLYKAPLIVHVERCPLLLTDGCVFPAIVPWKHIWMGEWIIVVHLPALCKALVYLLLVCPINHVASPAEHEQMCTRQCSDDTPRIVLTTDCHLGCLDCSLSVILLLCSHLMLFHSLLLTTPVSDRGYGQIKRTCYGQIKQKVLPLPRGTWCIRSGCLLAEKSQKRHFWVSLLTQ